MSVLGGIVALAIGLTCWAALDLSIRLGVAGAAGRPVDGLISAISLAATALVLGGLAVTVLAA